MLSLCRFPPLPPTKSSWKGLRWPGDLNPWLSCCEVALTLAITTDPPCCLFSGGWQSPFLTSPWGNTETLHPFYYSRQHTVQSRERDDMRLHHYPWRHILLLFLGFLLSHNLLLLVQDFLTIINNGERTDFLLQYFLSGNQMTDTLSSIKCVYMLFFFDFVLTCVVHK